MDLGRIALLVLAGIGGGLIGSIAGLASLVTYPVLLAIGLGPVTANVTNTVALIFSSAGSIVGSRPELAGQAVRARWLSGFGLIGGTAGGLLLLAGPAGAFEQVVPWLIGLGSLAILLKRPPAHPDQPRPDSRLLVPGVIAIGVYGGYFGAAAGVLLLALLLATTADTLPRCNALKNVILGVANGVAALVFIAFGSVNWATVPSLAAGLFIGARVGPIVVRHAPVRPLRFVIALGGIGLASYLGVQAYG